MSRPAERPSRSLLTLLVAASSLGLARAAPLDPGAPLRRVVGPPRGAAPMSRVDAARSGRAPSSLPRAPRLLWRARVQGGLSHGIAVDERGAIVAASGLGQLVQLSPGGVPEWSARLGPGVPLCAPVLTSDGTRVTVMSGPALIGVWPDGRLRYRRALEVEDARPVASPLPLEDGSLSVALGRVVVRIEPDGSLAAQARLSEPAATLLAHRGRVLVVGERGGVSELRAESTSVGLGSFGGPITGGAALVAPDTLVAVVDRRRLVALELTSSRERILLDDAAGLRGPPALGADGRLWVTTADGFVVAVDRAGRETRRALVEPAARLPARGLPRLALEPPPLLVDAAGYAAIVRAAEDAALLGPDGSLRAAPEASCPDPIAVEPSGPERMLVACHSGLLMLVGGGAVPSPSRGSGAAQ
ncbi:MAG: PQQ-binding-like beta-propeller repeat protein [Sorangiineae bacterium]|nr:PQQ-binding-like beta-propeller repeat protein [Sorangiineae bacterium]MEB2343297.1 PQQ-binding-like beta-propeller repeat protein [Deltaproteobacteria bacterium]